MSYRILSQDSQVDNDTWHTGLNNNDLIVGPSSAGKTRSYVKPNILQCKDGRWEGRYTAGYMTQPPARE